MLERIILITLLSAGWLSAAEPAMGVFTAHEDVGITPKSGSMRYDAASGDYVVTGGGANIWGTADAFHFVWKRISGDFAISADVRFLSEGGQKHRKGGFMIRQSLAPDSANISVSVHGDGMTSIQSRASTAAATEQIQSTLKAPRRIRVERRGSRFMMFAGNPGEELQPTGPAIVVFQDPVFVGLAVCSHDAGVLETVQLSNVKVEATGR
jgi:TolB protein